MNASSSEMVTAYKLIQQHWLIADSQLRFSMTNGVGPMRSVKNHMNYSLWSGKRSIKFPDEFDNYGNLVARGEEQEEDGILAFATAN